MSDPYVAARSIDPVGAPVVEENRSIGEILGHVTQDVSTLMRQEVALARAELSQSASKAGKGIGLLAGAALGGFFFLLFASVALWRALAEGPGLGWAALIVAVIWAVIAAILASVGRSELKKIRGLPETADTVGKIPNALKGQEENNR